jgi:imidazolonepropionase
VTSLSVHDAESVIVFDDAPVRGSVQGSVAVLERASLFCDDGVIESVGDRRSAEIELDARGCTVVPGFVDSHTHLPFYGWRADEDGARLGGVRYESLHREEGGIYRSARMLSDADDADVVEFSSELAAAMLHHGTTTFEMKSGYGLSVDSEVRQLRLARALADRVSQRTVATCLAAHAVPPGKSPGEWVGEAAEELLPLVAREGLAEACDVYVESISFALEHAARLAESANRLGLRLRIHADQLEDGQAGAFAARWGFATADHLNHTSPDAAIDLARSHTAAVLLPGATFTLRQSAKPPARSLWDEGAVVALGSDLNPGTSPIHSMPFVMALACRLYGLRPLESLAAATANAAYALGVHEVTGSLSPGRRADVVVLDVPAFDWVTYRPDHDPVIAVVCDGELAYVAPRARARVQPQGALS